MCRHVRLYISQQFCTANTYKKQTKTNKQKQTMAALHTLNLHAPEYGLYNGDRIMESKVWNTAPV